MNTKKMITLIMATVMILLFTTPIAMATEATEAQEEVVESTPAETPVVPAVNSENEFDTGVPEVGVDEVTDWADRKGSQIVTMLQRFAQPFSIIVFIGCAVLALIGAFGNSQLISRGIFGMAIAGIIYAIILYAPELIDLLLGFLRA